MMYAKFKGGILDGITHWEQVRFTENFKEELDSQYFGINPLWAQKVPLYKDCKFKDKVEFFLRRIMGNASSIYYSYDVLYEVGQRAESKLDILHLKPNNRAYARYAYRPEGSWVKPASLCGALPTIQILRGHDAWYLICSTSYCGPRVRGESLILTQSQSELVHHEVGKKYIVR